MDVKRNRTNSTSTWTSSEGAALHAGVRIEIPYERRVQAVLWDIGLVLAGALSVALAANVALVALHVG
jgi:hypothetical protein